MSPMPDNVLGNAKISWPALKPVITTLALTKVALSGSATVIWSSIAVAICFTLYCKVLVSGPKTGASLTAATVTSVVIVVDSIVLSFTLKLMVRFVVVGFSELLK